MTRARALALAGLGASVGLALAAPGALASGPAAIVAGHAAGSRQTLSGSCHFSGPITPDPPITVLPKPGAHFSYAGAGACTGTLDGAAIASAPITVTFTHVATVFDTCELGPDFGLAGTLALDAGPAPADFPITIDLARLAVVGPFALRTPGGGRALGTAQFEPASVAGALAQCAGAGISTATLAGSFTTSSPLVGALGAPAPSPARRTAAIHRDRRTRCGRGSARGRRRGSGRGARRCGRRRV